MVLHHNVHHFSAKFISKEFNPRLMSPAAILGLQPHFQAFFLAPQTHSQNLALGYLGGPCKNFISRTFRHVNL